MNIVVTGGAGFIGSHLVDRLVAEGNHVAVIDDLSGGDPDNVNPDAMLIQADCRDAQAMDNVFSILRPEVVYHLACNAAENKAQFSPIDITSRNYDAFIKVLTPFIKYGGKRFIFTSSIAVYGALQTPFKETDKPEPEDLYGINKLAIEQTLKVMSEVHGFEYVIARPHNVYGPRQNMTDPYRNVVTIFMNAVMNNKPYFIYGDGKQRRCFSYIDDVVEALYQCQVADVNGMTFNIGADKDYSLLELAKAIGGEFEHLPDRAQEVKEAVSDHSLAKKHLGYKDVTSLKEGIIKTWEWAKEKGPQPYKYTELEIESDKAPRNWKL